MAVKPLQRQKTQRKSSKFKTGIRWLLLLLLVFLLAYFSGRERPTSESIQYPEQIAQAAAEHQMDPFMIAAVARVESSWNPRAESRVGAKGLMQIMPATGHYLAAKRGLEYNEESLFDPVVSLDYGSYYLKELHAQFGTWELALAAYNAGPGQVEIWLADPNLALAGKLTHIPFDETRHYVQNVLHFYELYKQRYSVFPEA